MTNALCSGSFMCDIIASGLPGLGEPGGLTYAPNGIKLHPGGHAANVAIDLAQLGKSNIVAVGCLGDDLLGDYMESTLKENDVNVKAERLKGINTSKNIVLVVKGEDRRFYAELAANTMLSPGHIISTLKDTHPKTFYQGTVGGLRFLDGHLSEVLGEARKLGCLTVVDIIVPHDDGWRDLKASFPLIDALHCNDDESLALTNEKEPLAAINQIMEQGVKMCIITMGDEGLIAAVGDIRLKMPSLTVDAVDPTGAGDAFCAGIIDALLEAEIDGKSLQTIKTDMLKGILLRGAAAGAACVTVSGASTAVTAENVNRLIQEQADTVLAETFVI